MEKLHSQRDVLVKQREMRLTIVSQNKKDLPAQVFFIFHIFPATYPNGWQTEFCISNNLSNHLNWLSKRTAHRTAIYLKFNFIPSPEIVATSFEENYETKF